MDEWMNGRMWKVTKRQPVAKNSLKNYLWKNNEPQQLLCVHGETKLSITFRKSKDEQSQRNYTADSIERKFHVNWDFDQNICKT